MDKEIQERRVFFPLIFFAAFAIVAANNHFCSRFIKVAHQRNPFSVTWFGTFHCLVFTLVFFLLKRIGRHFLNLSFYFGLSYLTGRLEMVFLELVSLDKHAEKQEACLMWMFEVENGKIYGLVSL